MIKVLVWSRETPVPAFSRCLWETAMNRFSGLCISRCVKRWNRSSSSGPSRLSSSPAAAAARLASVASSATRALCTAWSQGSSRPSSTLARFTASSSPYWCWWWWWPWTCALCSWCWWRDSTFCTRCCAASSPMASYCRMSLVALSLLRSSPPLSLLRMPRPPSSTKSGSSSKEACGSRWPNISRAVCMALASGLMSTTSACWPGSLESTRTRLGSNSRSFTWSRPAPFSVGSVVPDSQPVAPWRMKTTTFSVGCGGRPLHFFASKSVQ
mmetsp:Transcript_113898/g.368015  ORF Transcript_113898/g.368015 Transcript_113898/m.368015 type:complete len:269 (-) Transcript_113898:467-1273(-)